MTKFTVRSGQIRVSDPCYDKDDDYLGMTLPAKNGEWVAHADFDDMGNWGDRVVSLTAEFVGKSKTVEVNQGRIAVDSGQAGIFDLDSYKNDKIVENVKRIHNDSICEDEPWYSICCDRTLSKNQWGVVPNGVVSSSGFGDGCYEVTYFSDKDGLATRVEIIFISDESDEEVDE